MNLVTRERILVQLYLYSRYENDFEVPNAVSQEGIAETVRAPRAHVSAVLKEMRDAGQVYSKLAHVNRGFRRKNVYFLTEKGKEAAGPLIEKIRAEIPEAFEDLENLMERVAGKPEKAVGSRTVEVFGREAEIKKVNEFVAGGKGKLLVIYGLPGIGKTHLLLHISQLHSAPYLDFTQPVNSACEFYTAIANGLAKKGRFRLKKNLQRNGYTPEARALAMEEMKGILLCIDNLQHLSPLQDELQVIFGGEVKIVAGARERAGFYTERAVVAGEVVEVLLPPLDRTAGELLLVKAGVSEPELRGEIYEKAGGHPLMMLLLAKGGTAANWKYLFDEVFSRLSERERHTLQMLAFAGEIPGFWERAGAATVIALERKGLVYWVENSCHVQPVLQDFIVNGLSVPEKQETGREIWKMIETTGGTTGLKAGMRVLVATENHEILAAYLIERFPEVLEMFETGFLEHVVGKLRKLGRAEIECMEAEVSVRKGEWKRAIEILSGITDKLPRYWEMERAYILSRAYNMGTDFARAVEIAGKGYTKFGHPKFLLVKGRAYAGMGEVERAMEVFLDALAAGAEQGITLAEIGNILMDKGDYEGAIGYFERAIGSTADGAIKNKIRINLAISEVNVGEVGKASRLLQEVLAETEAAGEIINHGFAAVNLAHIMLEQDAGRAAELAARALEIAEKLNLEMLEAPALINLGKAEIALGREGEGRRKVERGERKYAELRQKG
ncbi:MAG: tetratricopeptide repeat protein [Thermoplasmata archaeon]|nr:tetratricopeptide repeat protein [Thermoplasmata archaeon]